MSIRYINAAVFVILSLT